MSLLPSSPSPPPNVIFQELFSKLCMEAKEIPYDIITRTRDLCARYLGGAWIMVNPEHIRMRAITLVSLNSPTKFLSLKATAKNIIDHLHHCLSIIFPFIKQVSKQKFQFDLHRHWNQFPYFHKHNSYFIKFVIRKSTTYFDNWDLSMVTKQHVVAEALTWLLAGMLITRLLLAKLVLRLQSGCNLKQDAKASAD